MSTTYQAMVMIPGGTEPQFNGPHDEPIWSLYAWRYVDDDEPDAASWSPHEWLSDDDDGEFRCVGTGLSHGDAERLAERLGLAQ